MDEYPVQCLYYAAMSLDNESLYRQLGRLLESMPELPHGTGPLTDDMHRWLGRADALIQAWGETEDQIDFRAAAEDIADARPTRYGAAEKMKVVLYRVLGGLELLVPASARGAFIPAGSRFDAFAALTKVF